MERVEGYTVVYRQAEDVLEEEARGELACRLLGSGRRFSPDRDAVAELLAERESEG